MTAQAAESPTAAIPRFRRPFDWGTIDETVRVHGAVIARGLVDLSLVKRFNSEVSHWLTEHPRETASDTGSTQYDRFLGLKTMRVQGLPAKVPASHDLILNEEIVEWARRMLSPWCNQILLSVAELIRIGPRESPQVLHRDTGSWWPWLPREEHPLNVHAMVAMSPFTTETGATRVVLDSSRWPLERRPSPSQVLRAEMEPGDVLMFRGDTLHGGGANRTIDRVRSGLGLSYCVGWLRQVENYTLSVPPHVARELPDDLLKLLGYATHDATSVAGGLVGMYDNSDPLIALRQGRLAAS
ncbi:phytanoyl-CoA dioxygenase family protein [Nonomuraea sp. NPDC003707]